MSETLNTKTALEALAANKDLTQAQSRDLFQLVLTGEATPIQIAGILIALRCKGETAEEVAGAAETMRALSTKVSVDAPYLVDTCGTGGSGRKLFNISTAAAFVAAAAGAKVAKHGNRKMTSFSGSADLLEAAGVNLATTPEQIGRCIAEVGVGFMFAQAHHSAMRFAGPVRQELGVRTMMNILGPMTNPAGAKRQLIGVFDTNWQLKMAEVLNLLGCEHALLVNSDGLDEIALDGPTHVVELKAGNIQEYDIHPSDLGVQEQSVADITAASAESSLTLVMDALTKPDSAAADIVALNAGAAIYVSGVANNLANGVSMAQDAIASGLAKERLDELVRITKLMADLNAEQ